MELICGLQARQMFLESPGSVGNGQAPEKAMLPRVIQRAWNPVWIGYGW
jgi:hypothetical protein